MRTPIVTTLVAAIILFLPILVNAQENCSQYYPMSKGTKYTLSTYDKKGTEVKQSINEIIDFSESGNASRATIQTTLKDLKKNEDFTATFHVTCEGDKITLDINDMLQKQMESEMEGKDVTVVIEGTDPVYPNNLEVGQSLPDVRSDIKISSGSANFNFHVYSTNRKVVGKEKVTTPAGTFDCVVITMDNDIKTLLPKSGSSKSWMAEGVGMVKQEDYNKSGKLTESQVLTSFSR